MDHYVDVRLLPDPEFSQALLMNALYAKLHRGLVKRGTTRIGLSFPGYDAGNLRLGDHLRLHGSQDELQGFVNDEWLAGMRDHLRIEGVLPAPRTEQFLAVRRVQVKSNAERIRRRQMRRHNLSEQEARERVPDRLEKRLELPFLTLRSQSTGQNYRLFISQASALEAESGAFNTFGLSTTATLPAF